MKKYSHHIVAIVIITILVGILAWTNYVPGTMLAGWDDLHHEFNFQLAFTRTIQGVWRADQGLGAVAGHSHMSDLPRIIILWIISLIVPLQNIRFVYEILSLFVGALGMYVFVYILFRQIVRSRSSEEQRDPSASVGMTNESNIKTFNTSHFDSSPSARVEKSLSSVSMVALVSTFVYVLNLGTVQQFILPFEMFMVQFAVLPWLVLSASHYIHRPKTTHLLIFAFVALLFSPTAYAATLWYVFFGIFIIWLICQKSNIHWRHLLILIVVFISMNLYWILPNVYYAKYHGEEVRTSKINTIFSPDMFASNKQFGNIADALLLKSFLFDWQMYDYDEDEYPQIMQSWQEHLKNPIARGAGYLVTALGLAGIAVAIKRKDKRILPYAVFYFIPLVLLLNGTWPISTMYEQLSTLSPLVKEALRTPFTKVSIPAGFGMALFVGYFVFQLNTFGKRIFQIGATLAIISILYFALPAFQGGYIHRLVQVKIPTAYFEMFSYFKTQPRHARVALLPIHTFWNWTYYTWGYQGAGFLQFGIPQPLLDRDYGRWTKYNEQYNREMSYALYSQNVDIIAMTIKKYDIKYLVLDTSVFEPSLPTQHSLLNWISPTFVADTNLFEEPVLFGEHILVYKRLNQQESDVYLAAGLLTVEIPDSIHSPVDSVYSQNGTYISTNSTNTGASPLRTKLVSNATTTKKHIVELAHIEPRWGYCAERKNAASGRSVVGNGIEYISIDTNVCETFVFPELPHDISYILVLKSSNITGKPLTFCVKNLLTGHCDLNEQLQYDADNTTEHFHLPRLWDYGEGYQIEVSNIAQGKGESKNRLLSMEMWEIDEPIANRIEDMSKFVPVTVDKDTIFTREIRYAPRLLSPGMHTLVLDQAYEPGWIAIEIPNSKFEILNSKIRLLPHVRVNGWANAWLLEEQPKPANQSLREPLVILSLSKDAKANGKMGRGWTDSTIILLFWPQYLEYGGVLIGIATLGMLICKSIKYSKPQNSI